MAIAAATIPSTHRFVGSQQKLLINGEWVAAGSGALFDVIDPATEQVICQAASAEAVDVDRAVQAASRAFKDSAWTRMSPVARERLLAKLADLIEQHADELAYLESINNGKPFVQARTRDIPAAVNRLRYMAGWANKVEGRTLAPSIALPDSEFFAYTLRQPVGVVAQIVPWNFPLMMAVGKIAPALAMGCTTVLKPAEQTPLTALRLGELVQEAGFPPGVVNIITGFGETAGAPLVAHPLVDKIAFTGSTAVGKHIGMEAMKRMKRVSLELGGKSPVIVGPDVDLDAVVKGAANAIFYNQGQVCIAGSRLYVAESMFDKVVSGIVDIANSLKLGVGTDPKTDLGPLVSDAQLQRVLSYIEKGKQDGGRLLTGGTRVGDRGFFVKPTVFSNLDPASACVREEIFGPVLVATPYNDVDAVVEAANDTEYGLAASVWSRDVSFVHRITRRLQAGTVWVNCHGLLDATMPFGGFKQSGIGRESGLNGVELYTEVKTVLMRI
jgi:phenylacetaldehyde dehydrogenase